MVTVAIQELCKEMGGVQRKEAQAKDVIETIRPPIADTAEFSFTQNTETRKNSPRDILVPGQERDKYEH
jgi:hypothetical protein